jgi:hypothetical protein
MWGKHLIVDMSEGDPGRVRSAEHIRRFVEVLVDAIGMTAYGPPVALIAAGIASLRIAA